jgi:hypothetical protein
MIASRRAMLAAVLGCASAVGCGGASANAPRGFGTSQPKAQVARNADGSIRDGSRCEYNRPDREATETAGAGYLQPNVRRVFQIIGSSDDRRKVLICREIDTNFDGVKDVFRWYHDKGQSLREEADTNYDGRVDTWHSFAKGRIAESQIDNNHDGKPDEWRYYSDGRVSRVKRDRDGDGRPDVWEIYRNGRLERMGVDVDGDERVDRWDHDTDLRRSLDEEERKKEEQAAAAAAKQREQDNKDSEKAADESK